MASNGTHNGDIEEEKPLIYGLPEMDEEEAEKGMHKMQTTVPGMIFMGKLVGTAAAFGISKIPGAAVNSGIAVSDQQYVLLSVWFFNLALNIVNMWPMVYKAAIMKGGNIRANMYIYKVAEEDGKTVVLDEEGDVGIYNRANRSLHHMVENSIGFCAAAILAGAYYPKPVFGLSVIFAIARVMHQCGYTTGYGGHGIGFALALLTSSIIDGFLLVVAIQTFVA